MAPKSPKPIVAKFLAIAVPLVLLPAFAIAQLPAEPLQIPRGVPQFVHDSYVVDNHWATRSKRQSVVRVFHPPAKHPQSPFQVFANDKPSYIWVIRDNAETGDALFRMYYQANRQVRDSHEQGRKFRTDVAYAESPDGLTWTKPALDLFPGKTHAQPNNIVIGIPDRPELETCAPAVLEGLPEDARRGYRHVLMYRVKGRGAGDVSGIHLAGTKDGVRFDMGESMHIAHLHSDCPNTISHDPNTNTYVMFCRAKQMYRAFGDEPNDTGASRRMASMRSPELWTDWLQHDEPRTLLVPDERDGQTHHHFFYGMPTVHRHGLFWGALEVFRLNDFIHTELITSRDAIHWQRLPNRPKMIAYGEDGTWDDTMIFASPAWVEVGDEWRFYYTGWDGPHGTPERDGTVGLATCKRERLFSRRGPAGGGVVCTRTMVWPGGNLWLNLGFDGEDAVASVRISDRRRKPREGYDHAGCTISSEDETRRLVTWGEKSLAELAGQTIRLEIFLRDADLFAFGAESEK